MRGECEKSRFGGCRCPAADGLNLFEAPPLQANAPYALVQTGSQTDWGHKSGAGREVRLTMTLAVRGEQDEALADLVESAAAASRACQPGPDGA